MNEHNRRKKRRNQRARVDEESEEDELRGCGINEFHLRGIRVKWQLLSAASAAVLGGKTAKTCSHTYQALPQLKCVPGGKASDFLSTLLPQHLPLSQALWQAERRAWLSKNTLVR